MQNEVALAGMFVIHTLREVNLFSAPPLNRGAGDRSRALLVSLASSTVAMANQSSSVRQLTLSDTSSAPQPSATHSDVLPLLHLSATSSLTPQCRATLASNAAKTFAVQSLHSSFIPLLQRCSCFSLFFCNFNHFSFLQLPPVPNPPPSQLLPNTSHRACHYPSIATPASAALW